MAKISLLAAEPGLPIELENGPPSKAAITGYCIPFEPFPSVRAEVRRAKIDKSVAKVRANWGNILSRTQSNTDLIAIIAMPQQTKNSREDLLPEKYS